MVTKEIDIVVHKDKAEKSLKDVKTELQGVGKEAEKTNDQVNTGLEKTEKSSKKATKGVGFLSKGFKNLGTAIKATGIGLVVSLIAGLTLAFSRNQKVMDAVNTVFETTSIVFSEITNALVNVYESVAKNSENFNGLGKVLGGLLNLAIHPLKVGFYAIQLAIQQSQLAWEQSFLGGNDKDKMKALFLDIQETKKNIKEAGEQAIRSGIDIVANFGDAVNEVGAIGTKVGEELSKVSIKNAKLQAENIVALRNSAELAEARLAGLTFKYLRDAEIQRQIRDDVRLSIEDRIKANEKLGKILQEQNQEELKLANQKVKLAKAELATNPQRIEFQVAYQNALNGVADVNERITGQQSEQIVNEASLLDERKANLQELRNIGKTEEELAEQDLLTKLENQKTLIERTVENEIEKNNLLLEAEKEYQNGLDALKSEQKAKEDAIKAKQESEEKARLQKIADDEKKLAQSVADAKSNIANNTANLLIELAGRQSKLGKAIAVANTIRTGIEGVQNAYTTAQKSPVTALFPAYPLVQAGLAGAFSALQVKQILSTSDTATGGGGSQPQSAPAPSFNLVQGTETNQIAQSINGLNDNPVKAFVVATEVTTAQQANRNKVQTSSI